MYELTKSGVCYDLRSSPYVWHSSDGDMIFFFSSATHLRKFESELYKKVAWISDGLERRFHCEINMFELAAIHWYRQVETRGFLISVRGIEFSTIRDISFFVRVG